MRELTLSELDIVAGAGDECAAGSGNTYGGVNDTKSIGKDIIDVYEGLVAATSHIIERVATAF